MLGLTPAQLEHTGRVTGWPGNGGWASESGLTGAGPPAGLPGRTRNRLGRPEFRPGTDSESERVDHLQRPLRLHRRWWRTSRTAPAAPAGPKAAGRPRRQPRADIRVGAAN